MFTSTARERAFRGVASVGGGDGGGGVVGASEGEVDFWERDWHIDAVLLAAGGPGPQPPASGHSLRSEHSQCSLDPSPRHVRQLPHGRLQLSAAFLCSLHSAMESIQRDTQGHVQKNGHFPQCCHVGILPSGSSLSPGPDHGLRATRDRGTTDGPSLLMDVFEWSIATR
jgi:hypothetical protein